MLLKGEAWRGATADAPGEAEALLQDALQKYQVGGGNLQQGDGLERWARGRAGTCQA